MLLPSIDESDPHAVASRNVWLEILGQPMYSSAQVCEVLGKKTDNANDFARGLRREGRLLGIWDEQQFQHPSWQFRGERLDERVAALLAELPGKHNGWDRAMWLWFPNELLEDRSPWERWEQDAAGVIEAAREEFKPD